MKTSYLELEKKATESEASLIEVRKEFDIYREEKCENERLIKEELKEVRAKLLDER